MQRLPEGICRQIESPGARPNPLEYEAALVLSLREGLCPQVVPLQARGFILHEEQAGKTPKARSHQDSQESREGRARHRWWWLRWWLFAGLRTLPGASPVTATGYEPHGSGPADGTSDQEGSCAGEDPGSSGRQLQEVGPTEGGYRQSNQCDPDDGQ